MRKQLLLLGWTILLEIGLNFVGSAVIRGNNYETKIWIEYNANTYAWYADPSGPLVQIYFIAILHTGSNNQFRNYESGFPNFPEFFTLRKTTITNKQDYELWKFKFIVSKLVVGSGEQPLSLEFESNVFSLFSDEAIECIICRCNWFQVSTTFSKLSTIKQ